MTRNDQVRQYLSTTVGGGNPTFSQRNQTDLKYATMTNGFGVQRKSMGGGADLYLPHLRPKLTEGTPRSTTQSFLGIKNELDCNSPGRFNSKLFSPILK